jgi:Fe-S cluster assembly ATP-binding protein
MLLLTPKLIILDEIDSGLDIDAIKTIFDGVLNTIKYFSKDCSILVITHNPKILTYLSPDYVHIMMNGKIIKTGNMELVELIEMGGYEPFKEINV